MKKDKFWLNLYEELCKKRFLRDVEHEAEGICDVLAFREERDEYYNFWQTFADDGFKIAYWGREPIGSGYRPDEVGPLRQNLLLLMAAMEGEL